MDHITHLSPPIQVHMDEAWFDTTVASIDHFWIRRRFETFRRLWKKSDLGMKVAEVGCGHGLVLKQIKHSFGIDVDGYELNEMALKQADPACGHLFYYNIHDRTSSLKEVYDVIFLFDVIEHLEDDKAFLESVLFHLKPGGYLIVNVPADRELFSDYDRVQGHQRRYDIHMLEALASVTGLHVESWSYWGFFYIPILKLRKKMLVGVPDSEVTKRGFAAKLGLSNTLLLALGRLERVPNYRAGTSVMAILRKG